MDIVVVRLVTEEQQNAVIDLILFFFVLADCIGRDVYFIAIVGDFIVEVVKVRPEVSIEFADYGVVGDGL